MSATDDPVRVPGATPDEVAAIIAALAARPAAPVPPPSDYERWRRGRLTALVRSRR